MRGLKRRNIIKIISGNKVASFTDAWIETFWHLNRIFEDKSHLLQMRGLKHRDAAVFKLQQESHLLQMRGLKQ